jgi:4-amino-4-deoxy-L-arabinose transferase-like glycosyltransferase
VRLSYVLPWDFPLNDGGMFFVMTRDLISTGLGMPPTTTYNDLAIPFAYPPLGFYLAAVVTTVTGLDLIELFRWLPLVLSAACIPAFALLARELLSRTAARAATYLYALVPASFVWPIMGGGLTRSLGLLFALLALAALVRTLDRGSRRALVLAAVLSGLAAMSHPNAAAFLALSAILIALLRSPTRASLLRLSVVGAGAIVVAAPWWLTVMARSGSSPFTAAASASRTDDLIVPAIGTLLRWNAWNEPLFPLVSAAALAGLAVSLARRDLLLPLWIVALAFALPGPFQMLSAIPLALLGGVAVAAAFELPIAARPARAIAVAGVGYLMVAAVLAFVGVLEGLPSEERVAMRWVAAQTPPTARVLVVTTRSWGMDAAGEWLPALAERASVVVPQGADWLPGVAQERTIQHQRAEECAQSDGDCLERLADDGVDFDFVYLASVRTGSDQASISCCEPLAAALRNDARYSVAYESATVLIFARN